MKKLIALLLAVMMVLSLVACGTKNEEPAEETAEESVEETKEETVEEAVEEETEEAAEESEEAEEVVEETEEAAEETVKIAFVSGLGGIEDKSFNQFSYEGVIRFAEANGVEHTAYQVAEDTEAAHEEAINQAISEGAKVVVMAGKQFCTPLSNLCEANAEVLFLALDATFEDLTVETIPANVALISYQEEQAGYLAGYAAVKEGYKSLGFMGGDDIAPVVRYGYGFVQGAEAAAAELELTDVTVNYWYADTFTANEATDAKMNEWYSNGTEVVFACGSSIYESCLTPAEANGGKIIGVDVDQSAVSELIITSAVKDLANSVEQALTSAHDNSWAWPTVYAGSCQFLGAANGCIGLPMITSHFEVFTAAEYDSIYASMASGGIAVDNSGDPAVHPETVNVTVDWQ